MVCYEKSVIAFVLLLICPGPALAQTCATTENGRRVVLSENGSWKYAKGDECELASSTDSEAKTTEVLIGSERYPAGIRKTIINEDFFDIKAQVVDKNSQSLLVLWHESEQQCSGTNYFGNPRSMSDNNSRLFLENGEVIEFIDRRNKGRRTVRDARTKTVPSLMSGSEEERRVDICQQWIAYRITDSEIDAIQESNISRIEIKSQLSANPELFQVRQNRATLAKQSEALGL